MTPPLLRSTPFAHPFRLSCSQYLGDLFSFAPWYSVALMALVVLLLAGREVMARRRGASRGRAAFVLGTSSMFVSSFSVTLLALLVILQQEPWYEPHYAVPLLGMLLGNTMTGVALASDRLTSRSTSSVRSSSSA